MRLDASPTIYGLFDSKLYFPVTAKDAQGQYTSHLACMDLETNGIDLIAPNSSLSKPLAKSGDHLYFLEEQRDPSLWPWNR